MRPDTAVVVLSFDGNRDMWLPFFSFFRKYWTDCPYPVYLVVNQLDFEFSGVKVLKTGPSRDWSTEVKSALSMVPESNLIVLLEDYFIYKPVETTFIEHAIGVMEQEQAVYLRLGTFPSRYRSLWPSVPVSGNPGFNRVDESARYLVNLQAAIWKKDSLRQLLTEGESPWSFEINASRRFAESGQIALGLDSRPGLNHVHGPITYLCGALTRGVLMRSAVRLAKQEGIRLETGQRKVETAIQELGRTIYIALPLPARKVYLAIRKRLRKLIHE